MTLEYDPCRVCDNCGGPSTRAKTCGECQVAERAFEAGLKEGAARASGLSLNEYQKLAMRTATPGNNEKDLIVAGLGLAGEAGEVVELIKKHVGHGHDLDREKLTKELGDVCWYLARIAYWAGISLDDVATANVEKLKRRYPDGFSEERSINRTDVA